jgi:putative glycerol-1-phosphate prenyltransferase
MNQNVYLQILESKKAGRPLFTVLIDPDKVDAKSLEHLIGLGLEAKVDCFFVGGSLVISNHLDACIQQIKAACNIPVILFPGSPSQVSKYADALLYLSLISGRNPELLIGQHVISAPFVKKSGLEIMPTGYMVIDGGAPTTVS